MSIRRMNSQERQDIMSRLDHLSTAERSRLMSQVRSRDTSPEMRLRKALWAEGCRYLTPVGWKKRYGMRLIGQPDLIFAGPKVAVFVDGCYWHGCPLKCKGVPRTNTEFWNQKMETNIHRDLEVASALRDRGWRVFRYWEHQLKRNEDLKEIVSEIIAAVKTPMQER